VRPCWLPLWQHPVEVPGQHATTGWPCEAYVPSTGPYCNQPPAGRATSDEWVAGFAESGDKLLVACQTTGEAIGDGRRNVSNLWDGIAIPRDKLNAHGLSVHLQPDNEFNPSRVIVYAADILLGDTGSHHLAKC
jgi:hypothetical protein